MSMKIKFLTFLLLCFVGLEVPACGTINGAGEDIESAGETIQGAAK